MLVGGAAGAGGAADPGPYGPAKICDAVVTGAAAPGIVGGGETGSSGPVTGGIGSPEAVWGGGGGASGGGATPTFMGA